MPREKTNDDKTIGTRLRTARLAAGFTQADLADVLGVKFQQVQKYETGHNRVCASKLFRAADILKVDITYFQPGGRGESVMDDPDALMAAVAVNKMPPYVKQSALRVLEIMADTTAAT